MDIGYEVKDIICQVKLRTLAPKSLLVSTFFNLPQLYHPSINAGGLTGASDYCDHNYNHMILFGYFLCVRNSLKDIDYVSDVGHQADRHRLRAVHIVAGRGRCRGGILSQSGKN